MQPDMNGQMPQQTIQMPAGMTLEQMMKSGMFSQMKVQFTFMPQNGQTQQTDENGIPTGIPV